MAAAWRGRAGRATLGGMDQHAPRLGSDDPAEISSQEQRPWWQDGQRRNTVAMWVFGALALGAIALGALAIGRLMVRRARIRNLVIDELVIRRLRILDPDWPASPTSEPVAIEPPGGPEEAEEAGPAVRSGASRPRGASRSGARRAAVRSGNRVPST